MDFFARCGSISSLLLKVDKVGTEFAFRGQSRFRVADRVSSLRGESHPSQHRVAEVSREVFHSATEFGRVTTQLPN